MRPVLKTICWVLFWIVDNVLSLRDIELSVPEAVSIGGTATLSCRWSLDPGETLYTVKWYHGAQEFFRYIPKELPHTRVFPRPAITVDVSKSGAQQVVLKNARRSYSGRYRCEVSADAPYFHTVYKSSFMHVVELPEAPPIITSEKSWYSTGDLLRANCTASPADPPANLTWLLNSEEVKGLPINFNLPPIFSTTDRVNYALEEANTIIFSPWKIHDDRNYSVSYRQNRNVDKTPTKFYNNKDISKKVGVKTNVGNLHLNIINSTADLKGKFNDETEVKANNTPVNEEARVKLPSGSILVLRVKSDHFVKGRMNLTCIAKVFSEYAAEAKLIIEEERPQLAPVMGSLDTSTGINCNINMLFISNAISLLLLMN